MKQNYQRIFVALDGSETQDQVAERAIDIALATGAKIKFGHVVENAPTFMYSDNYLNPAIFSNIVPKLQEAAEASIAPVVDKARKAGVAHVDFEIQVGEVRETLLESLIKPYDPDLIICGDRGLNAAQYIFIGSTSKSIIEQAECDVLVVKK